MLRPAGVMLVKAHLHPLHLGVDGVHCIVLSEWQVRLLLLLAGCGAISKSPRCKGSSDWGDPSALQATSCSCAPRHSKGEPMLDSSPARCPLAGPSCIHIAVAARAQSEDFWLPQVSFANLSLHREWEGGARPS